MEGGRGGKGRGKADCTPGPSPRQAGPLAMISANSHPNPQIRLLKRTLWFTSILQMTKLKCKRCQLSQPEVFDSRDWIFSINLAWPPQTHAGSWTENT